MKYAFTSLSAMALIAGLAACSQVGGSVLPAAGARAPMTLRAIPIETPVPAASANPQETPAPSPSPRPAHKGH